MPHFKQNVLSPNSPQNLITAPAPWLSLLKSILSHSNTLEPPEMQMLHAEMLEKLAHCHSLITSDRLLNQDSSWSYESRASCSNYIRKVLNQTGPSGLWMLWFLNKSQHTCRYKCSSTVRTVPDKNAFIHPQVMTAVPSGDSFTCMSSKTYVSCAEIQPRWPDDRTLFTAVHRNICILFLAPGRLPKAVKTPYKYRPFVSSVAN